jgi:hypothetical protein
MELMRLIASPARDGNATSDAGMKDGNRHRID